MEDSRSSRSKRNPIRSSTPGPHRRPPGRWHFPRMAAGTPVSPQLHPLETNACTQAIPPQGTTGQQNPPTTGASTKGIPSTEYVDTNLSHLCPIHCSLLSHRALNTRLIYSSGQKVSSSATESMPKPVRKLISESVASGFPIGFDLEAASSSKDALHTHGKGSPQQIKQDRLIEDLAKEGHFVMQNSNALTLWDRESPLIFPSMCQCLFDINEVKQSMDKAEASSKKSDTIPYNGALATAIAWNERLDDLRSQMKEHEEQKFNGRPSSSDPLSPWCITCGQLRRFPLTFISIYANRDIPTPTKLIEDLPLPPGVGIYTDPIHIMEISITCFTVDEERQVRGILDLTDIPYSVFDVCSHFFHPYLQVRSNLTEKGMLSALRLQCANIRRGYLEEMQQKAETLCSKCELEKGALTKLAGFMLSDASTLPWISLCETIPEESMKTIPTSALLASKDYPKTTQLPNSDFRAELRPIPPNPENLCHLSDDGNGLLSHMCRTIFRLPDSTSGDVGLAWGPKPFCIRPRAKVLVSDDLSNKSFLAGYMATPLETRTCHTLENLPHDVICAIPRQFGRSITSIPPDNPSMPKIQKGRRSSDSLGLRPRPIPQPCWWRWTPRSTVPIGILSPTRPITPAAHTPSCLMEEIKPGDEDDEISSSRTARRSSKTLTEEGVIVRSWETSFLGSGPMIWKDADLNTIPSYRNLSWLPLHDKLAEHINRMKVMIPRKKLSDSSSNQN